MTRSKARQRAGAEGHAKEERCSRDVLRTRLDHVMGLGLNTTCRYDILVVGLAII